MTPPTSRVWNGCSRIQIRPFTPLVNFPPRHPKHASLPFINTPCSSLSFPSRVQSSGLLFDVDVNSGLAGIDNIMSGFETVPDDSSTYNAITRTTAINIIDAIKRKRSGLREVLSKGRFPVCIEPAAEAGWPNVSFGKTMRLNGRLKNRVRWPKGRPGLRVPSARPLRRR